ncbi:MAG TPA: aldo/keto reductase [Kofleriaceae bacterium]|jgi:aryl-alcohol dehydrogenase-like predicted oxidoreductase
MTKTPDPATATAGGDIASLASYHLLGKSGLRVSPLALGTMTFGNTWGWGVDPTTAHALMDRYLAAGGNFIDTADGYAAGASESIIGDYMERTRTRDRIVLATKFTFSEQPGNPNSGGNGRKNIHRALEGSLRRLKTDYIDVYFLHVWDGVTPVGEVMQTLSDLVRVGKIRHIGLSDVPAWYFARAQTLADAKDLERVCALQLEYSLVERNIEREHIPAAIEMGVGVTPWSPLASGLLSGKYTRTAADKTSGPGRLEKFTTTTNPAFAKLFTERNWRIVDAVGAIARELSAPVASVALAWVARRPGVASTIIGATRVEQLEANLRALDLVLPGEALARLDAASAIDLVHPYQFFTPEMRAMTTAGTPVRAEPSWYRA